MTLLGRGPGEKYPDSTLPLPSSLLLFFPPAMPSQSACGRWDGVCRDGRVGRAGECVCGQREWSLHRLPDSTWALGTGGLALASQPGAVLL